MWHFLITDLLPPADDHAEHLRPRLPQFEARLAAGRRSPAPPTWREALLQLAGVAVRPGADWPVACDLAARAGRLGEAAGWWVVTPVRLTAGLDHVQLERVGSRLSPSVVEAFNRELGPGDGRLVELGDTLLWALPRALQVRTHDPSGLVGHDIGPRLPAGPDAAVIRRWMTEAQMWLHAADSPDGVNALWPWGGGASAAHGGVPALPWAVEGADGWVGALASRSRDGAAESSAGERVGLWRLADHAGPEGAFAAADAVWTQEIERALSSAGEVSVWLAGHRHRLSRLDRWRPWRRWHTPRPWWR